MKPFKHIIMALAATAIAIPAVAQQETIEKSDFGKWYISPAFGWVHPEGDDPVKPGPYVTVRLGYDYNEWWTFEGSVLYAWKLEERLGGYGYWKNGVLQEPDKRFSYAQRLGGKRGFGDTTMTQFYFDTLFHFTRYDKFDPYLTFGVGGTLYGDDIAGGRFFAIGRVGGGFMYHLSDSWSLRIDSRIYNSGYHNDFSLSVDAGFVYRFTANKIKTDDGVNKLDPVRDIGDATPIINEMFRFNIEFDTSDSAIKPIYNEQLNHLADRLTKSPNSTAIIEGHADRRQLPQPSGHDYNMRLSERRAVAVRDYLVDQGVRTENLTPIGYGFTRPIAENDPVEGNAKNRRVDVKINNRTAPNS